MRSRVDIGRLAERARVRLRPRLQKLGKVIGHRGAIEHRHASAGALQEESADVLIAADAGAADEVELYGEVDRSLRRDGPDGKSVAAHRLDAVIQKVEAHAHLADHLFMKRGDGVRLAEERGDGDL